MQVVKLITKFVRNLVLYGSPMPLFFKDTPEPPKPVDPYVQAQAQTGLNLNTALTNAALQRVNQYTPYGSMTYNVQNTPSQFNEQGFNSAMDNFNRGLSERAPTREEFTTAGVPQVSSNIDFTDQGRQLFDQQNRINTEMGNVSESLAARAGEAVGQPFSFDNLPALRSQIDRSGLQAVNLPSKDYSQERTQAIDSVFNDQRSRLDPMFEQDTRALETQLANQGIARGSEAWNSSIDGLDKRKNDAYRGALAQALTTGGAEQSRLAGLDGLQFGQQMALRGSQEAEQLTDLELNNIGRQRGMEEQIFLRDRPLNELNAFRSGVQLQGPNFSGPAIPQGTGPANIGAAFGQQYEGQLANYNAQIAENNALTNGLFSLGAAAFGGPMAGLFGFGKKG
jgi:hypothetical protein